MLESFAQLGYDVDFDELVEHAKAILDSIPELQQECGGISKSSAVESPELISESKWIGPIHVWPRWPSVTMGRKRITSCSKLMFIEDGKGAFIIAS